MQEAPHLGASESLRLRREVPRQAGEDGEARGEDGEGTEERGAVWQPFAPSCSRPGVLCWVLKANPA